MSRPFCQNYQILWDASEFFSYIELQEGTNTIQIIATCGKERISERVDVIFQPALWINYEWPHQLIKDGVDYTETPINITGFVSDPTASVVVATDCDGTANGVDAILEGNTFTANVVLTEGHNCVTAIASRNGEIAKKNYSVDVTDDGRVMWTPGKSDSSSISSSKLDLGYLEVLPGETKFYEATVSTDQHSSQGIYDVWYTTDSASCNKASPPAGLTFCIEPSSFKVYPNTHYTLAFIIKAQDYLPPGTYYLCQEYPDCGSVYILNLIVKP